MTAWGRCVLEIEDITDCTFERKPELHDHLVLSVTRECYEMHRRSKTWAATSQGEFRFDMMYTVPSLPECQKRIRQILLDSCSLFLAKPATLQFLGANSLEMARLSIDSEIFEKSL